MTLDSDSATYQSEADHAEQQLHSPTYLKSVAQFSDTQPVHASCDIYSTNGIKLLGAGSRISSAIYDHLLHHKLVPRLDDCVETAETLSAGDIVDAAEQLLAFDPLLQKLQSVLPDFSLITRPLAAIPLNPAIAFKLTLMRSQRAELFQHSIFIALVSIYIGIRSGLSEKKLTRLATAAVLHDIGILHIDPALLKRNHRMTASERRHLYAHPLTAWMILKQYQEFDEEVANGVLHHHERLDGSGYPQGLLSDGISDFGQMIAAAEIVASRHSRENEHFESIRLETMLKLNSRRYGRELVGLLSVFCSDIAEPPGPGRETLEQARQHSFVVSAVLSGWESLRDQAPHGQLYEFIDARIRALKMDLLDAGLNPYGVEKNMLGMEDTPRAGTEAAILLEEAIWQIRSILREVRRRWPKIDTRAGNANFAFIAEWIADVESLIHQGSPE